MSLGYSCPSHTCVYHDDRCAEIKEIKENIKELFGKVNEQGGDKKAMEVELKNISKPRNRRKGNIEKRHIRTDPQQEKQMGDHDVRLARKRKGIRHQRGS